MLLEALRMAYLSLRDVKDENVDAYYEKLQNRLNEKKVRRRTKERINFSPSILI